MPERKIKALFGRCDSNIYWSRYNPANFGDWITPYIFVKISGRPPSFQRPSPGITTVFGAGSIFRHINIANSAVIWGSGLISESDCFQKPKEILAVRGPLTKKVLERKGFLCPQSFGDPGLLIARLFNAKNESKAYALGVVPHFKEMDLAREVHASALCSGEIKLIDPTQPIEKIIRDICACDAIASSSLHGIIVSHAYGVKCTWVRFKPKWSEKIEGDDIKFYDHYSALGLNAHVSGPLRVNCEVSASALLEHVKEQAIPDPTNLIDNLEISCPFF